MIFLGERVVSVTLCDLWLIFRPQLFQSLIQVLIRLQHINIILRSILCFIYSRLVVFLRLASLLNVVFQEEVEAIFQLKFPLYPIIRLIFVPRLLLLSIFRTVHRIIHLIFAQQLHIFTHEIVLTFVAEVIFAVRARNLHTVSLLAHVADSFVIEHLYIAVDKLITTFGAL